MPEIEPEDDWLLNPDDEARTAKMGEAELRIIDDCILSNITHQFRKTAKVVALTLAALSKQFPDLTDASYCGRIKHLAAAGLIEAAGNLNRMRHSEVRVPNRERGEMQAPSGALTG